MLFRSVISNFSKSIFQRSLINSFVEARLVSELSHSMKELSKLLFDLLWRDPCVEIVVLRLLEARFVLTLGAAS